MSGTASKRLRCFTFAILVGWGSFSCTPSAWAWGSLGHRIATETAALLAAPKVPSLTVREALLRDRFYLGVFANYPDTLYRQLVLSRGLPLKAETVTHYFDWDLVKEDAKSLPMALPDFNRWLKTRPYPETGLAPWRVEQLQGEAIRFAQSGKLQDALYWLGVLSHYIADATMPYHATSDYDGIKTGNQGIHLFYEQQCVSDLEPELAPLVLERARKRQDQSSKQGFPQPTDPVRWMFRVYEESFGEIESVRKLDQPGARKVETQCRRWKDSIVERLARAASLISDSWVSVLSRVPDGLSPEPAGASKDGISSMLSAPRYLELPEAAPKTGKP